MNEWTPTLTGLAINAVVVIFGCGTVWQSVRDLKRRMGIEETDRKEGSEKNNTRREKWEDRMERKQSIHEMIPECVTEFKTISTSLSALKGSVDTLIKIGRP